MKKMLAVTMSTASLTFYKILSGFIVAKIVAIYTGPSGIALLGQLQSLITALNGVVVAPVGNGIVRYTSANAPGDYDSCSKWWRAAIILSLCLLFIVASMGILGRNYIASFLLKESSYQWVVILCCLVLPLSIVNTAFVSVINGEQKYKRFIGVGFASNTLSTISVLLLIYFYGLSGALVAVAINTSIAGGVVLLVSLREPWFKFKYWFGQVNKQHLKDIGGYVLMAITAAIATPLALMQLRLYLVNFAGWESAGQWQAVWKISEVYLSIITMALSTFYLPQLSKIKSGEEIKVEIWRTAKVVLPIVIVLAFFVYILRDFIIYVLFTKDFIPARDLFSIQLVGDVVKIFAWLFAFPMLSRGATKWFIFSEVFFSCTLVVFGYYFIKSFGAHGANFAYLVNYIIYFIFVFFNINKIV
ncbi:O-antigen translocase, partial [Escherichia coli]